MTNTTAASRTQHPAIAVGSAPMISDKPSRVARDFS